MGIFNNTGDTGVLDSVLVAEVFGDAVAAPETAAQGVSAGKCIVVAASAGTCGLANHQTADRDSLTGLGNVIFVIGVQCAHMAGAFH